MTILEEEIILWCRVPRSDCKHGAAEFHTTQFQGEATGCQLRGVGCWSVFKFERYPYRTWRGLLTHSDPHGNIRSSDYNLLARWIKVNDDHSAIIKSQSSNSSSGITAFAYMTGTPEEMDKQFEEQARIQRQQFDMIRAQQESINTLK